MFERKYIHVPASVVNENGVADFEKLLAEYAISVGNIGWQTLVDPITGKVLLKRTKRVVVQEVRKVIRQMPTVQGKGVRMSRDFSIKELDELANIWPQGKRRRDRKMRSVTVYAFVVLNVMYSKLNDDAYRADYVQFCNALARVVRAYYERVNNDEVGRFLCESAHVVEEGLSNQVAKDHKDFPPILI